MSEYSTFQEELWAGTFGSEYIARNQGPEIIATNIALFSKIINNTKNVDSIIEFGCNIGLNLIALHELLPCADIAGLEINEAAYKELTRLNFVKGYHGSAFNFKIDYQRDFSFTKGVLIHINPELLPRMYDLLYASSRRYICVCEYYNPSPVEIKYRGTDAALFKRDFAGELIEKFPDLSLVDYGFAYHMDNNWKADDITWFLLEK